MSTAIQWTHRPGTRSETWNPVVGCTKVSQGCKHCYAKTIHDMRHKAYREGKLQNIPQYAHPFEKVQLMHERLTLPLKWKKPRTVFVNSMSDLFHADVPFDFIDQVFAIMAATGQHTYQILTKRPERMAEYFSERPSLRIENDNFPSMPSWAIDASNWHQWPLPNVWLGTSVEDQAAADERIPHLLKSPAKVRFLSCEPLLGPVDLADLAFWVDEHGVIVGVEDRDPQDIPHIHWVIVGGESGLKARQMNPAWVDQIRDQCEAAGVPFFFKQWGRWVGEMDVPSTDQRNRPHSDEFVTIIRDEDGFEIDYTGYYMYDYGRSGGPETFCGNTYHNWPA